MKLAVYPANSPQYILVHRQRSETVSRAVDTLSPSIEHMRIDHGRTDILVPEEFLHRPNIIAVFKQMGGERMPEGVTAKHMEAEGNFRGAIICLSG